MQNMVIDQASARVREPRGIDRRLLNGDSWGSALALACAPGHPERVSEIVIAGVTITRRSEIDWLRRFALPRRAVRRALSRVLE